MSLLLSAELAATCNALGYYDAKSNKYYADSNTLETVKDLIRYLRRDDDTHDIRRQLGETKVVQADLLPLLKGYWEETDLFDVLLRLLVNLTTPAIMLWNDELPTDRTVRNYYLQIEEHLQTYKEAFADESVWAVLSTRLSKILETDYAERGDENSLIIERILILIRNILYVRPDPDREKRTDNDASVHDQVLWALHQSGTLDIILFMTSSTDEKVYYMHILEILSFMLREQRPGDLAQAAMQRSEMEKIRDEAELLAIRHRETNQRQQKVKMYSGARHSRFGGTYVLKSMKSISDNELIYHKPLNKLDALNFDVDKMKPKTPKNRLPVKSNTFERRSAFSIRLFLKEFCVEFLNGAYNALMYHVKDNLVRAKAQAHDESYYLWALRFFMEFNRCYKFEVKLVSEQMSIQSFHYVQQLIESYFDLIKTDKGKSALWSRRLHLSLMAYRELLLTLRAMDKSPDGSVRDSARVIQNNIFYVLEYRELILTLLVNYDELKMSNTYLQDLMETQHIFLKMLESFCGSAGSLVVQKKSKTRQKKKTTAPAAPPQPDLNLEGLWDETAPQLSSVLEGNQDFTEDVVPFDAASEVPIDDQKSEAMKNVQRTLRNGRFENAISLLRAAREVWPENDCFGSSNMAPEEEFLALRDIFFADLGENEPRPVPVQEQPIYDDNDEEENEDGQINYGEGDFKFEDFCNRLCHPRIVKACGLALKNFEANSVNTNHCIVKLLHRIAFDSKMSAMVFQVSIFRTFQKIFTYKALPQYKELVKFATYVIRQFIRLAETNKKIYMEALFWKTKGEAFDIEHGYLSYHQQSQAMARGWSELEEDELRRLFMEHQENQLEDDVVDWIVNNLIDNTKTRRGVLKKLKEMYLLSNDYTRGRRPGAPVPIPRHWSAEEETQLQELFQQFQDSDDPVGNILQNLDVPRSKNKTVEKLLFLGLIRDKKEVYKKRTAKSGGSGRRVSGSDGESSGSDDDGGSSTSAAKHVVKKKPGGGSSRQKNSTRKPKRKSFYKVSDGQLTKLLVDIVNSEMTDALRWLKESLEDAIEDFQEDGGEGIPLVPIMDYAIEAMEKPNFQQTLKALGITEPFDEQETYWRIAADVPLEILRKHRDLLQSAIDGNLVVAPEATDQPGPSRDSEDSSDEDVFAQLRKFTNPETVPDNGLEGTVVANGSNSDAESLPQFLDAGDEGKENEESSGLLNENVLSDRANKKKVRHVLEDSDDEEDVARVLTEKDAEEIDGNARSSPDEDGGLVVETQKKKTPKVSGDSDADSLDEGGGSVVNTLETRRQNGLTDSENDKENGNRDASTKKITRMLDSDSDSNQDDDANVKRSRADSGSDIEKPTPKRSRFISSDDED